MKNMDLPNGNVYNAEVFRILLNYEISRSKRYPNPLAMLQIKVTPAAIDAETLSAAPLIFSSALSTYLRSSDIPSRAGNLFTVLLPNSDKYGAQSVCERLLSVFKNKFEDPRGNSITFSLHIGVTAHPGGEAITGGGLLDKAGEALKQSTLKGPNTYVFLS